MTEHSCASMWFSYSSQVLLGGGVWGLQFLELFPPMDLNIKLKDISVRMFLHQQEPKSKADKEADGDVCVA